MWPRLTFLEDTEVRRVEDLLTAAVPADMQWQAAPNPALEDHHLALGGLRVLQELPQEDTHRRSGIT